MLVCTLYFNFLLPPSPSQSFSIVLNQTMARNLCKKRWPWIRPYFPASVPVIFLSVSYASSNFLPNQPQLPPQLPPLPPTSTYHSVPLYLESYPSVLELPFASVCVRIFRTMQSSSISFNISRLIVGDIYTPLSCVTASSQWIISMIQPVLDIISCIIYTTTVYVNSTYILTSQNRSPIRPMSVMSSNFLLCRCLLANT